MSNLLQMSTLGVPNVNVRLVKRDALTGKILHVVEGHNRVTKMALMGLVRFINGEFNDTTPLMISDYVPRYLALGSNQPGTINPGVSTEVNVNDTKLLTEIPPRIKLSQRNIENRYTNPYIKLIIRAFIPVDQFVNQSIAEAGLFTDVTGNNCWARITFDRFEKEPNTVIDVTWEITVVSVKSSNQPYEELDKTILEDAIDNALDKISSAQPLYKTLCDELKIAYKLYDSSTLTQEEVRSEANTLDSITIPDAAPITLEEYNNLLRTSYDILGND